MTCTIDDCPKLAIARGWCNTHYKRWWKTGSPNLHIRTDAERVWEKVDKSKLDGSCWGWSAGINQYGYATIRWHGRKVHAIRAVYELTNGPIPTGYEIDHLCHTNATDCKGGVTCPHRECVNPDHLEAVTRAENIRRGIHHNANKTHCLRGHELVEDNIYMHAGAGYCLECRRLRDRKRNAKRYGKASRNA